MNDNQPKAEGKPQRQTCTPGNHSYTQVGTGFGQQAQSLGALPPARVVLVCGRCADLVVKEIPK